jgi:hypothetical protein
LPLSDAQRWDFMHIGSTVANVAVAVAMYQSLGFGPWVISDVVPFVSYDGAEDVVVDQPMVVAFGRIPGGGALELVQPMSENGPQARMLQQRPGLNHIAYWCQNLSIGAKSLISSGARLFATSSPAVADWSSRGRPGHIAGLLDQVTTATFELPDGSLLELVATSMWVSGLPALFGAAVHDVIDRPHGRKVIP